MTENDTPRKVGTVRSVAGKRRQSSAHVPQIGALAESSLSSAQSFGLGGFIASPNAGVVLLFQKQDGNVVLLRGTDGAPLWSTQTQGTGADRLTVQRDGNIVVTAQGRVVWASNTSGHPGAKLVAQDDGNVVLLGADGKPVWDTGTDGFVGTRSGNTVTPGDILKSAGAGAWDFLSHPGDALTGAFDVITHPVDSVVDFANAIAEKATLVAGGGFGALAGAVLGGIAGVFVMNPALGAELGFKMGLTVGSGVATIEPGAVRGALLAGLVAVRDAAGNLLAGSEDAPSVTFAPVTSLLAGTRIASAIDLSKVYAAPQHSVSFGTTSAAPSWLSDVIANANAAPLERAHADDTAASTAMTAPQKKKKLAIGVAILIALVLILVIAKRRQKGKR